MSRISVDGLVEWEESRGIVERLVKSGVCRRIFARETADILVEVAFALSSGDWGARAVVVVKGQIIEVFIIQKVFLTEQVAECRVPKGMGLIRAELEHGNSIGCGEVDTRSLRL